MFAKLIASGITVPAAQLGCFSSGGLPIKGDCVDVGWFPYVGRCRIGALAGDV
ncbi:MAG: hypothetical protein HXS46_12975 [Theionarchaea archaeon]|nr:hypothetical protein [Theionarchaea archaeon]